MKAIYLDPHPHFCRPVGPPCPRRVQQERGEEERGRVEFGVPSLGWPGDPEGRLQGVISGSGSEPMLLLLSLQPLLLTATWKRPGRSFGLFSLQKTLRDFLERAIRELQAWHSGRLPGQPSPRPPRQEPRVPGSQGRRRPAYPNSAHPGERSLFPL